MQVRELMTKNIHTIRPDATVKDAAKMMLSLDVGILPVSDGIRLLGTLTDRDIVLRCVSQGFDPAKVPVKRFMTKNPASCFENQTLKEAAEIMEKNKIRRIPVLNRDKRIIGILSIGDLAAPGEGHDIAAEILEKVAKRRPKVAI